MIVLFLIIVLLILVVVVVDPVGQSGSFLVLLLYRVSLVLLLEYVRMRSDSVGDESPSGPFYHDTIAIIVVLILTSDPSVILSCCLSSSVSCG